MNQNKPEPTLEESIKQVMQKLPPVIRIYLAQEKYTPVTRSLMTKYALRIDQGGVLERELMLLLMGIENPDEFTKTLAEDANLSQQVINGIVQDVNAQIFVPLRNEMARGVAQPVKPVVSAPQTQTPPRFFHLENKLAARGAAIPPRQVQQPIPVAPIAPQPKPVQPSPLAAAIGNVLSAQPKIAPQPPRPAVAPSVVGPRPSSNIAPLPPKFMSPHPSLKATEGTAKSFGSQTSPKPSTLLEDHEEPHIELPTSPKATQGTVIASMPTKVTEEAVRPPASISPVQPRVVPPPSNLPGAMPPIFAPSMPSAPEVAEVHTLPIVPKVEPPMPPRPSAVLPATPPQSYTVDPYREPIE